MIKRKKQRIFAISLSQGEEAYLDACARIRGITVASLVRRLITVVASDQLVAGVLDDDACKRRHKSERAYKPPSGACDG